MKKGLAHIAKNPHETQIWPNLRAQIWPNFAYQTVCFAAAKTIFFLKTCVLWARFPVRRVVCVSSRHQHFGATLLSDSSLSQTIRRLPQCFTWSDAICQNGHMTHDQKRRNNDAIVVNFNMVNDSVKCSLLVATICQTWQIRRCKLVPQCNFAQTSTPALVELAQVWQRATFKGAMLLKESYHRPAKYTMRP